jgi:dimethylhistidine N-methyltransferase
MAIYRYSISKRYGLMNLELENKEFIEDVREGLMAKNKFLLSKYFYNKEGDKIFQAIMGMEEYYLTNCEYEILSNNRESIVQKLIAANEKFQLVELGAGDGLKTKLLLEYMMKEKLEFEYIPIDISEDVLLELETSLKSTWPNLPLKKLKATYFEGLNAIKGSGKPKLVLFLGSNIGNFKKTEVSHFLSELYKSMSRGDYLLLGVDLKKDPNIILKAYNDSKGITKAFNLNLLRRINVELGADFDLTKFGHYPTYDPVSGTTKSYLFSKERQTVYIEALNLEVVFKYAEPILMEVSNKYEREELELITKELGYVCVENYLDCKHWYLNTLLKKR